MKRKVAATLLPIFCIALLLAAWATVPGKLMSRVKAECLEMSGQLSVEDVALYTPQDPTSLYSRVEHWQSQLIAAEYGMPLDFVYVGDELAYSTHLEWLYLYLENTVSLFPPYSYESASKNLCTIVNGISRDSVNIMSYELFGDDWSFYTLMTEDTYIPMSVSMHSQTNMDIIPKFFDMALYTYNDFFGFKFAPADGMDFTEQVTAAMQKAIETQGNYVVESIYLDPDQNVELVFTVHCYPDYMELGAALRIPNVAIPDEYMDAQEITT